MKGDWKWRASSDSGRPVRRSAGEMHLRGEVSGGRGVEDTKRISKTLR